MDKPVIIDYSNNELCINKKKFARKSTQIVSFLTKTN